MPFFSVIIPTYNRAALLREALDTVFAQTFTDYEVIVIDDGSTDDTVQVIAGFGDKIRFLQQPNQGPGAARNRGIQSAIGDYIAFLDSDDIWFPWTLKTYREAIASQPGVVWVTGTSVEGDFGTKPDINEQAAPTYAVFPNYLATAGQKIWMAGCSVTLARDILQAAGGFTNAHVNAEDLDLWLRLGCAKGFMRILSPPVFAYRPQPGGAVTNLLKTCAGVRYLLIQEKSGAYPGGAMRAGERRQILGEHVRPASLDLARAGYRQEALGLYGQSLGLHLRLGRWKYLAGFWLILLANLGKSAPAR